MTLDELNSHVEFRDLTHYRHDAPVPDLDPYFYMSSAMTVEEAAALISREGATPKYVEVHESDGGELGYEVVFWIKNPKAPS